MSKMQISETIQQKVTDLDWEPCTLFELAVLTRDVSQLLIEALNEYQRGLDRDELKALK